jgi:hypothetical protein
MKSQETYISSFQLLHLVDPKLLLLPPSRPRSLSLLLLDGEPMFLLDPEITRAVPFAAGLFVVPDLFGSLSSLRSMV